ncbi:haloacid dehalogenase-like hydrolase domain-containing protein 2 [Macrosteles quadrilineatus]|uniref:haloacid dehalogenase-like hydrolase domain-containing protein 2 n=1 Tax=Macrosteles quadrilineatus TaxID=74068 RepID=UPI0023E341F2|nr:haloacid dehalogenase-like hydrolase domain-containing protein 2 [Macrosteles quadrilineatus]
MGTRQKLCKSVLIDLSGTIHIGNEITPSAVEALNRLRQSNVKIKFVTNTTKESRRCLYERLCKLGFQLKIEEIWSSLWAAKNAVSSQSLKPFLLISPDALEDFQGLDKFEGEPNAVVVGLAPELFEYKTLSEAFRLLLNGAKLIAIHEARYFKGDDGKLALGPGPFVKGLEYAADCKAQVLGKPCPEFFCTGLEGVDPSEAIMIGDDVRDDIKGAQDLGMRGYLVKTGKYRNGDENKIDPPPYHTVDNFAAAVDDILRQLSL